MDFEFRQRARAIKLLARVYNLEEEVIVREVAIMTESGIIDLVAVHAELSRDEVLSEYSRCLLLARDQLIVESGDPTPNRSG